MVPGRQTQPSATDAWKKGARRRSTVIKGIGAAAGVLSIALVSKFAIGAWIPAVVIPLIVLLLKGIHRHHCLIADAFVVPPGWKPPRRRHSVVLFVNEVHRGTLHTLAYARALAPEHLVAVCIVSELEALNRIEHGWAKHRIDVPLEVIYSVDGASTRAVIGYVDQIRERWPDHTVTVLIPELAIRHWWEKFLHDQTTALKARPLLRLGTVVTSVPYRAD